MHFVYLTTNLINEKQYIGDHSTDNLNDGYLGSGIALKNSVKKYGKKNFKNEILDFFDTKKEAFDAQERWINEFNSLIPMGYNISPKGGLGIPGCLSEKSLKRMRDNVSKANKGRRSHRKGKKLSSDHIKNISKNHFNPNKGKNLNELHKLRISLNHADTSGNKNGMFGLIHSDESKEKNRTSHLKENLSKERLIKMRESARKKLRVHCKYCNKYITTSMHTRWHGENCKEKLILA